MKGSFSAIAFRKFQLHRQTDGNYFSFDQTMCFLRLCLVELNESLEFFYLNIFLVNMGNRKTDYLEKRTFMNY